MPSSYRLQIVHVLDGKVASWPPGDDLETDLETELVRRVLEKGVGIFRTSAHVGQDVRTAFQDMLFELKSRARPA